jgi:hypothetical protein
VVSSSIRPMALADGAAELEVDVQLLDPLHKIRAISLHYVRSETLKEQPRRQSALSWAPLPGAEQASVPISGQVARASLQLRAAPADVFAFQVSYVRDDNERVFTQPQFFRVPPADGANVATSPRRGDVPLSPVEIAELRKLLEAAEPRQRRAAAERLARAVPEGKDQAVAQALEERLGDADAATRQAAARALGVWGNSQSVPALIKLLSREDTFTQRAALEGLGMLRNEATAERVARCLTNFHLRRQAGQVLQAIGAGAEKATLPYLTHEDGGVRTEACRVLGVIGTHKSLPALRKAAQDADGFVAQAAKDALKALAGRP